jgi:hypothetical protein
MAQLKSDLYKPPMLLLEYDKPITSPAKLGVTDLSFFGDVLDKSFKIGNTNVSLGGLISGFQNKTQGTQITQQKLNLNGSKSQSGNLNLGLDNAASKVNSIKSKNVNNKVDYSSSHTKSGLPKAQVEDVRTMTDPATGWAKVLSKAQGDSVLADPNDTRKHIVLKSELIGAPDDNSGIIWVRRGVAPWDFTTIGTVDYTDRSATIQKFPKSKSTTTYASSAPTTPIRYQGDDKYKVVILNDNVNFNYCVVSLYKNWKVTKRATVVDINDSTTTDYMSGGQIKYPEEEMIIDVNTLNKNSQAVDSVQTNQKYIIDFYKLSHWGKPNFGFGVEQFNFSGDSRKSIQQTRGNYQKDQESTDNFYVDSWGKGPEQITLVGVIELPYAYDKDSVWTDFINGTKTVQGKSFHSTIEDFFLWNNNPQNINNGEKLYILDYYKQITYEVTFKSRKWNQSVDRQSLLNFEFNFIVLNKTEKIEELRK